MIAPVRRRFVLQLSRDEGISLRHALEDVLTLERDGGLPDELPLYVARLERVLKRLTAGLTWTQEER